MTPSEKCSCFEPKAACYLHPKPTSEPRESLCTVKHIKGREIKMVLKYVGEDDCDWRTVDDDSELAYEWTVIDSVPLQQIADLTRERDEWVRKYRNIERANSEMSCNDHVVFGELLIQRDDLRKELEEAKAKSNFFMGSAQQNASERDAVQADFDKLSVTGHLVAIQSETLRIKSEKLLDCIKSALSSIRWSRAQDNATQRNNCISSAEKSLEQALEKENS